MKFKELPEGHYYLTSVNKKTNVAFVQRLENPEIMPAYHLEQDTVQVIHDGRSYNNKGYFFPKDLDAMEVVYKTFDEVKEERKAYSARLGHVKRRLNNNERLTGATLDLAVRLITCDDPEATINSDPFYKGIAEKLREGVPLSDYEGHIMVDVILLRARLG